MKKNPDMLVSYGGIVLPWGEETDPCKIVLTTVQISDGSQHHALLKGKPLETDKDANGTAFRELMEEAGIPRKKLFRLLKQPILDYKRLTGKHQIKHVVLGLFATSALEPYQPTDTKHPRADAVPLEQAAELLRNRDDAKQLCSILHILQETWDRLHGFTANDGFFAQHPKLARELDENMKKFLTA